MSDCKRYFQLDSFVVCFCLARGVEKRDEWMFCKHFLADRASVWRGSSMWTDMQRCSSILVQHSLLDNILQYLSAASCSLQRWHFCMLTISQLLLRVSNQTPPIKYSLHPNTSSSCSIVNGSWAYQQWNLFLYWNMLFLCKLTDSNMESANKFLQSYLNHSLFISVFIVHVCP